MTAVVIGTALARPWAAVVVVEVVTHLPPTTTTMTAGVPLVATVLAAMTTAAEHRLVSSMTGVMEGMDVPHRVVAWEGLMSMVHRVPVTLTILTILGLDLLLVATMTPT